MSVTLSPFTLRAFREWFVGTSLGYIDDQFSAVGLEPVMLPEELRPNGQRRARVEEWYAGVDWTKPTDVNRVLKVFEFVLGEATPDERDKLVRRLKQDGYVIGPEGRISSGSSATMTIDQTGVQDAEMFGIYEQRILSNIELDPALAVGTAKELVEATCKLVLEDSNIRVEPDWTVPQLFKAAARTLDLTVDSVSAERTGADEIRKVLGALAQIVGGTSELRNMYGTGHGRPRRVRLAPRHARLVAGAALTLVRFLLDTRGERSSSEAARPANVRGRS